MPKAQSVGALPGCDNLKSLKILTVLDKINCEAYRSCAESPFQ